MTVLDSAREKERARVQVRAVINRLKLKPHPEGGWYREIYRSGGRVQTARGSRSAITTIYYLLERGQISRWHVVDADEIWNFYEGAPLELLAYDPKRRALVRSVLGATKNDRERAAVVRKGVWQAARSMGDFSLMGCSVAPGFEFDGFRFVTQVRSFRAHFKGALAPLASLL